MCVHPSEVAVRTAFSAIELLYSHVPIPASGMWTPGAISTVGMGVETRVSPAWFEYDASAAAMMNEQTTRRMAVARCLRAHDDRARTNFPTQQKSHSCLSAWLSRSVWPVSRALCRGATIHLFASSLRANRFFALNLRSAPKTDQPLYFALPLALADSTHLLWLLDLVVVPALLIRDLTRHTSHVTRE